MEIIDKLKKNIIEGNIFFRAVRDPFTLNNTSLNIETNFEKEIRKINREKGQTTRTKEVGDKDGNPLRSTTLIGLNTITFSNVGFGLSNVEISDICKVSNVDLKLGFGKRKGMLESNEGKFELDDKNVAMNELDKLRNQVLSGQNSSLDVRVGFSVESKRVCNEVIINLKKEHINCIIVNEGGNVLHKDDYVSTSSDKLLAMIYAQREYEKHFGKKLPIVIYGKDNDIKVLNDSYFIEKKDVILKQLEKKIAHLKDPNNSMLFLTFKNEINSDENVKKNISVKIEKMISNYSGCEHQRELIALAMLAKDFLGKERAENSIQKKIDTLFSFSSALKLQRDAKCKHVYGVSKAYTSIVKNVHNLFGDSFIKKNQDLILRAGIESSLVDISQNHNKKIQEIQKNKNSKIILKYIKDELGKMGVQNNFDDKFKEILELRAKNNTWFKPIANSTLEILNINANKGKSNVPNLSI